MRIMKGFIVILLVALLDRVPTATSEKATDAAIDVKEPLNAIEAVGDETATDNRDARSPALLPFNNQNVGVQNQGSLQQPNQQISLPFQSGHSPVFNAIQRHSNFRVQQQPSFGLQRQHNFGGQQQNNFANLNQQNTPGFIQRFVGQNQQTFSGQNQQQLGQNQQQFGQHPPTFGQQFQNNIGRQQPNAVFLSQSQRQNQPQYSGNQQGQNFAGFPHQGQSGVRNEQTSNHAATHGGHQASQGQKGYADKNQQGQNQHGFRSQSQHNNQGFEGHQQNQNQPQFANQHQNNQQRGFNQQGQQPSHFREQQPGFENNQRLQGQFNPQQANQFRNQNTQGPFNSPQSFGNAGQPSLRQPVVGLFSNNPSCNDNDPNCNRATHIGIFYPISPIRST